MAALNLSKLGRRLLVTACCAGVMASGACSISDLPDDASVVGPGEVDEVLTLDEADTVSELPIDQLELKPVPGNFLRFVQSMSPDGSVLLIWDVLSVDNNSDNDPDNDPENDPGSPYEIQPDVTVVDLVKRSVRGTITTQGFWPNDVLFDPSGEKAYLVEDGFVEILDLTQLKSVGDFTFQGELAIASEAGLFASFWFDERKDTHVVSTFDSERSAVFDIPLDAGCWCDNLYIAISPDGTTVVVARGLFRYNYVALDVRTGQTRDLPRPPPRPTEVYSQSHIPRFSADGRIVFNGHLVTIERQFLLFGVELDTGEPFTLDLTRVIRENVPGFASYGVEGIPVVSGRNGETYLKSRSGTSTFLIGLDTEKLEVFPGPFQKRASGAFYGASYSVATDRFISVEQAFGETEEEGYSVRWFNAGPDTFTFGVKMRSWGITVDATGFSGFGSGERGLFVHETGAQVAINFETGESETPVDLDLLLLQDRDINESVTPSQSGAFVYNGSDYLWVGASVVPWDGDFSGRAFVFDASGEPVAVRNTDDRPSLMVDADGSALYYVENDILWQWNWLDDNAIQVARIPSYMYGSPTQVREVGDGRHLLIGNNFVDREQKILVDPWSPFVTPGSLYSWRSLTKNSEVVAIEITRNDVVFTGEEYLGPISLPPPNASVVLDDATEAVRLGSGESGEILYALTDSGLYLLDPLTLEILDIAELEEFSFHKLHISDLTVSPDGRFIVVETIGEEGDRAVSVIDTLKLTFVVDTAPEEIAIEAIAVGNGADDTAQLVMFLVGGLGVSLVSALALAILSRSRPKALGGTS